MGYWGYRLSNDDKIMFLKVNVPTIKLAAVLNSETTKGVSREHQPY